MQNGHAVNFVKIIIGKGQIQGVGYPETGVGIGFLGNLNQFLGTIDPRIVYVDIFEYLQQPAVAAAQIQNFFP